MACLKAPIAITLGVYTSRSFIDCNLFSNGMIRSCKISTEKRVSPSLCNSRASRLRERPTVFLFAIAVAERCTMDCLVADISAEGQRVCVTVRWLTLSLFTCCQFVIVM